MKPTMAQSALPWSLGRRVILASLSRSARKVMMTREIAVRDQTIRRWMRSDVQSFIAQVSLVANDLRPVANLDALENIGNRLTVELAVLTSAAYRVLLDRGVPAEDARRLVADIGWDYYAFLLRLASLPFRMTSRDPGKRLQRTIRLLLRFPFSAPGAPGYAVRVRIENDDILTHFTHCPPHSFVRALVASRTDRGDLQAFQQSWCQYDWPGADLIAADGNRGHYVRQKTLSHGDPVCDMCWAARGQARTT